MSLNITVQTAALVNVRVTSTLNDFMAEKRFDRGLTIIDLKSRLELITGASTATMKLQVYNDKDEKLFALDNDNALLGSYPIEENYRIHVEDVTRAHGEFMDVSKVEKFEISDATYDQRNDSVRDFLRRNKLGKYNPEEAAAMEAAAKAKAEAEEAKVATITVGSRCQVAAQGEPTKRGEVMYVGKIHVQKGLWVGVKYDEPLGKNDGSIEGKRYFECPMKYGSFVQPWKVTVGDFPELDYDDEEM